MTDDPYRFCPDCPWAGHTDADDCPECGSSFFPTVAEVRS